jgi:hypothetical protein
LPGKQIVFVTSQQYAGNLGGLAGADAKCQLLASNAGLCGTFMAWLSDSRTSASTRLSHSSNPYVLVDGTTMVAPNWTGLLSSGGPVNPILKDERGMVHSSTDVWTNTTPSGDISSASCGDWTSASTTAGVGQVGDATRTDNGWTQLILDDCSGSASLYCMQQ